MGARLAVSKVVSKVVAMAATTVETTDDPPAVWKASKKAEN